jgi:hypothetical protein
VSSFGATRQADGRRGLGGVDCKAIQPGIDDATSRSPAGPAPEKTNQRGLTPLGPYNTLAEIDFGGTGSAIGGAHCLGTHTEFACMQVPVWGHICLTEGSRDAPRESVRIKRVDLVC